MKVSELTGAKLDFWVAKALGGTAEIVPQRVCGAHGITFIDERPACRVGIDYFDPSTNWGHGGPILNQENISFWQDPDWHNGAIGTPRFLAAYDIEAEEGRYWSEETGSDPAMIVGESTMGGNTKLEAVMRCYVAKKYGNEVPDAE